ncbi:NAD(P)H-binding protein [Nocardia cyriacigeorgica]|uniref:NAD(P)H-binding protein n=1 Tax=Nocardia cyriacigeorgica TaxID=135487 RepID=UPI0018955601|nr:NAD(P)H-binding protein [Nocardia cyriacigeorgica]MBF6084040.1 NAD(P)H-binding protein [Nocardia cyriacigeorgica]
MDNSTVLVIGGTGKVGRRVAALLRERGVDVRVASRSGDLRFNWTDPQTWDAALNGVRAAFVVPLDVSPSPTPSLVRAAAAAGVERIVLLSARGIDTPGYFGDDYAGGRSHLDGEAALRESGLSWTVLRPSWFMQNFSEGAFLDGVLSGRLALLTADGKAAFVDAADIAEVAVAALTGSGHDGQTYDLTGPAPLSIPEALAEIATASGRRADYVPVDVADFERELVSLGLSAADIELWSGALRSIRTSSDAVVADGVRRALGREPRTFAEFAAAEAGAWRV